MLNKGYIRELISQMEQAIEDVFNVMDELEEYIESVDGEEEVTGNFCEGVRDDG